MAEIKAKEALIHILKENQVEYIFGIPGATETFFMDTLEDHPDIHYILSMHEIVAVGAAEGYARASGKPGYLFLHTGTGLAAALPMLSNAYYGGVPLVVTAGQQDTRLLASEPAMSDDLVKIASPFVKWGIEVRHAQDLPMIMNRAFKEAEHSPTGPVFVALPNNIMDEALTYEPFRTTKLDNHLHPADSSINKAVEILSNAESPAMIVEDGVAKNNALTEVVAFAEKIGAGVYQPWMADVNFPVHHPQYLYDLNVNSPVTREMLKKHDVLVVVGSLFFSQAVYVEEPLITSSAKVIQIDNNCWQLGKNFPIACGIEGSIKTALLDLMKALSDAPGGLDAEKVKKRIQRISAEKQKMVAAFDAETAEHYDDSPIHGTRLMAEISVALPPNARIVDDCWSYSAILRRTLPIQESKSYMRARGGGSIGWGLPGAIGVKMASTDRPVVCISGDGSAMWSIQSLWTASRYQLPVTFIILSNGAYRQVQMMKTVLMGQGVRGRHLGTILEGPKNDFCKLAEGMGLPAQRVEKPDALKRALEKAFSLNQPNLVEVVVDSSF